MKMLFASLLAIAFSPAATLLHAQSQETAALYAAARPYTDETLPQLKAHVHELSGIKPDINQTDLPGLLASVSEIVMAQMPRVPNLIAHEEIALEQPAPPTPSGGYSGGSGIGGSGRSRAQSVSVTPVPTTQESKLVQQPWRRYDYFILAEHQPDGSVLFNESRKSLEKSSTTVTPRGTGFASSWFLFLPFNLVESHFRLLGTQKVGHLQTYVVAFAQDPSAVKVPGFIEMPSGRVPLLYHGIAWIDQQTFRIVRLRSDLLAPQHQVRLSEVSSTVDFAEARIPNLEAPLWLPKSVEILWDIDGQRSGELHRYSNYGLFHATSRIVD